MRLIFILTLLAHLLAVCWCQASEAESVSYVSRECESKLANINSLKDFKKFMKHYHVVIETSKKPDKGLMSTQKGSRKCFDQKEMLFELEELISNQNDGVCQLDYISKVIDYHLNNVIKIKKDLKQSPDEALNTNGRTRKTFAARMFSLFAHQVVLTCKSKLMDRVLKAEKQYSCEAVLDLVLPVEILTEQSDDEKVKKFGEFMRNFERVEDFSLMFSKMNPFKSYFDVSTSLEAAAKVNKLKDLCREREPFYSALFLPVSSLSQLGYGFEDDSSSSNELKCWLATALICQGILKVHIKPKSIEDSEGQYVEIKFDTPPADALIDETTSSRMLPDEMKFQDFIDEISPKAIELVNKKTSSTNRLRRTLKLAKKFLSGRVKIDESQSQMAHLFKDVLTRGEEDFETAVSFNGRYNNPGLYTPTRMLTDDADTVMAVSSLFLSPMKAFAVNLCVGVAFAGVFTYFTIFSGAVAAGRKLKKDPDLSGNFKEAFRQTMDKRMEDYHKYADRKGWDHKWLGTVYVGSQLKS